MAGLIRGGHLRLMGVRPEGMSTMHGYESFAGSGAFDRGRSAAHGSVRPCAEKDRSPE
jgi:hypothetical protein